MNQAHHPGLLCDSAPCTGHARAVGQGSTQLSTSEESGHARAQDCDATCPALLREQVRINAQKTKSLCCAAAGIIDPISSTAEALIPHEKLREAASADATLIAQERPPAQPVMGYKPESGVQLLKVQGLRSNQLTNMRLNFRERIHKSHPVRTAGNVVRDNQLDEPHDMHSHVVNVFQKQHIRTLQTQDIQPLNHIQATVIDKLSTPSIPTTLSTANRRTKEVLRLLNQISKLVVSPKLGLYLAYLSSSSFMPFHARWNYHRNKDRENGTDTLNPTRSIFWKPTKLHPVTNGTSQKPEGCRPETQIPQRPKAALNHPFQIQHPSWLQAITKNGACPFPANSSMQEAT